MSNYTAIGRQHLQEKKAFQSQNTDGKCDISVSPYNNDCIVNPDYLTTYRPGAHDGFSCKEGQKV